MDDLPEKSKNPYNISEMNYTINLLQPKRLQSSNTNKYAVFLVSPSETIEHHDERNPTDPRINHAYDIRSR